MEFSLRDSYIRTCTLKPHFSFNLVIRNIIEDEESLGFYTMIKYRHSACLDLHAQLYLSLSLL